MKNKGLLIFFMGFAVACLYVVISSEQLANADEKVAADTKTEKKQVSDEKKKKVYRPIIEAVLPEGFPEPGPVGEVALKEYPIYRSAKAEGMTAFPKLFRHITKNDIAMTTPVEMSMSQGDENEQNGEASDSVEQWRMVDMSFIYPKPTQGEVGQDVNVEVADYPAELVYSYGIVGVLNGNLLQRASEEILRKLDEPNGKYVKDGDWRVMGYNSPMVPASRRYWEVQLPVRERVEEVKNPKEE